MAGYLKMGDRNYIGTLVSSSDGLENGVFVTMDYANGQVDVPADDATGLVGFVQNEIDFLNPHGKDETDFSIDTDDYARVSVATEGKMYVTDKITSTYAGISVGDEMAVGANGQLALVADLTAVDLTGFHTTFIVKEKVTLYGNDAVIVVTKVK
jgi:hypothetical protein